MSEPYALVISGGSLGDGTGLESGVPVDIAVDEHGEIAEIGPALQGAQTIDADGCVVIPGLVDLHTHLRQPGFEDAETIETASRAAALGGYTAMVATPDTNPAIDNAAMVREVQLLAARALCDVEVAGAVTVGRAGEQLAPMAEMAALGVKLFTDVHPVADSRLMRRAMEYAAGLDITIAQTACDPGLAAGGHLNEGAVSSRIGIAGVPAEAEQVMVERDLAIARMTGASLHFMHLTTGRSIDAVESARSAGIDVTCDVTPHHLVLTDQACLGFEPQFKVHPPLRSEADRSAVAKALTNGLVEAIATDHLPRSPDTKEHPFDLASAGMLGLEHALAVVLGSELFDLDLAAVVNLLSTRPAEIAGISNIHGGPIAVGRPANLAVVDVSEQWTVNAVQLASLSRNTPYDGWTLTGRVRHTILHGEAVVVNGEATR